MLKISQSLSHFPNSLIYQSIPDSLHHRSTSQYPFTKLPISIDTPTKIRTTFKNQTFSHLATFIPNSPKIKNPLKSKDFQTIYLFKTYSHRTIPIKHSWIFIIYILNEDDFLLFLTFVRLKTFDCFSFNFYIEPSTDIFLANERSHSPSAMTTFNQSYKHGVCLSVAIS